MDTPQTHFWLAGQVVLFVSVVEDAGAFAIPAAAAPAAMACCFCCRLMLDMGAFGCGGARPGAFWGSVEGALSDGIGILCDFASSTSLLFSSINMCKKLTA